MSQRWLDDALEATGLRPGSTFPRDLVCDIVMHLPVSIEVLPRLSTLAVRMWLRERGVYHSVDSVDRTLHGCLVARGGHGIVFLDAGDEEAERRFTLAHEIAHFVLDHLLPRLHALKVFGERISPILDRERPPTREELLSAVLEKVQLGVQIHLMDRGRDGAITSWDVEESEQRADRLALELLAPAQTARAGLKRVLGDADYLGRQQEHAAEHLAVRFGLPTEVARSYVRLLASWRPRPSLSKEIFGGN